MDNILKKDVVQKEALKAWKDNNQQGTIEVITGLGKTFISLHALYERPKNDDMHLFLAETTSRSKDLLNDIKKYNTIFKKDVLNDYNLQFHCYQEVYKWEKRKFGLVIADEIHESLTPTYSKFYFNNKYDAIIGLSATIKTSIEYEIDGEKVTKGMLLDKIAPICFKYSIDQGQKDSTSRKLNIYVLYHRLDDKTKNVEAGSKNKRFFQTEKASYNYINKQFKSSYWIKEEGLKAAMLRVWSTKRSNSLYKLVSKINVVKNVINMISGKSIVFGNNIDSLLQVTPNVVSSRNTKQKNNYIRDQFDKNKINVIGSFKKLQQGANLDDLDNCIIMSYYSTEGKFIQEIGRLRDNDKIGNVFILVTLETKEEDWFNKMTENASEFNYIHCKDFKHLQKEYTKNNT